MLKTANYTVLSVSFSCDIVSILLLDYYIVLLVTYLGSYCGKYSGNIFVPFYWPLFLPVCADPYYKGISLGPIRICTRSKRNNWV